MPMGRSSHSRLRAVVSDTNASFRTKSQSFLHGRATVVNGGISCFAWLISRRRVMVIVTTCCGGLTHMSRRLRASQAVLCLNVAAVLA
jgi:hypothetical protein